MALQFPTLQQYIAYLERTYGAEGRSIATLMKREPALSIAGAKGLLQQLCDFEAEKRGNA